MDQLLGEVSFWGTTTRVQRNKIRVQKGYSYPLQPWPKSYLEDNLKHNRVKVHRAVWACAASVTTASRRRLVQDWRSLIFGPPSILLTEAFQQALGQIGKQRRLNTGSRISIIATPMLIPGEGKIISYFIRTSPILQGQTALVAACLSLSDRWWVTWHHPLSQTAFNT